MSLEQDCGPPIAALALPTPKQQVVAGYHDRRFVVSPGQPDGKDRAEFGLRPYQEEAVAATIEGFRQFRRQLRVCPTGGGKTIEFAALAEHYQPERTLVIAHREELIEQAREKIQKFTGLCADLEKAES